MTDTQPPGPYVQQKLTREQAVAYLERISLSPDLINAPASLDLLTTITLAQLEQIPKDTSPLHVSEEQWKGPADTPIKLSSNSPGMPLGTASLDRIVKEHKGAFCFSINATMAAFLRAFGYRVSEMTSNCYKCLGNNPETHEEGWKWGSRTHELLVVDWEGSGDRWLVDGAWGPFAITKPIRLAHNETVSGANEFEAYQLRNEVIPLSSWMPRPVDEIPGWTFYRYITPVGTPVTLPITDATPGFWSPLFHFLPISVPLLDFGLYHHYSASHELASFTAFLLITRVLPNTGGARRTLMYREIEGDTKKCAKVSTYGGPEAQGSEEGRDVEWVEMKVGTLKEWLATNMGYKWD